MSAPRVMMLAALLALGSPLEAQSPTPRERAGELERQARAATTDGESSRLWFLALAEWHEEGARAVLSMDLDRLEHAVQQGDRALMVALTWRARACPRVFIEMHEQVVSVLAYVVGHWHGQGGTRLANQARLADLLLNGADRARRNGESCFRGDASPELTERAGATNHSEVHDVHCP